MNTSRNIYEQRFSIYSYLVDKDLDLTFPNLMCLLQEVAWAHSNKADVGWKFLQSQNMFWALTKFYLKVNRLPKWEEEVLVRTWAKPVQLIIHPRDFEVLDRQGNILILATSEWVILDKTNFRPQKNVFEEEARMIESQHAIADRIPRIPKLTAVENTVCHPVLYSDLDMNQHVNNTRYLMWAIDEYNPDFVHTHRITECCINYVSQAKIGTNYAIHREEIGDNQFVTSIFEEKEKQEFCRIQMNWAIR